MAGHSPAFRTSRDTLWRYRSRIGYFDATERLGSQIVEAIPRLGSSLETEFSQELIHQSFPKQITFPIQVQSIFDEELRVWVRTLGKETQWQQSE